MRKIENELLSIDPTPRKLVVTPTDMKFFEVDGSDARMERVREYGADGKLLHTYLRDPMGVRWMDMEEVKDDPNKSFS